LVLDDFCLAKWWWQRRVKKAKTTTTIYFSPTGTSPDCLKSPQNHSRKGTKFSLVVAEPHSDIQNHHRSSRKKSAKTAGWWLELISHSKTTTIRPGSCSRRSGLSPFFRIWRPALDTSSSAT